MKVILYAFLAAAFYAINIPASKMLLRDVGPTMMAALLYLGVFGCGVNKLPCGAVVDQFSRVLGYPEFDSKSRSVVFAILEGRGSVRHPIDEKGKFAPFHSVFGRWIQ